jgi:hypothetical protein
MSPYSDSTGFVGVPYTDVAMTRSRELNTLDLICAIMCGVEANVIT